MSLKMLSKFKFFRISVIIFLLLSLLTVLYIISDENSLKIIKTASTFIDNDEDIYVLPLSEEILDYHRRLNLTNPGYMGKGVVLPKIMPDDIKAEKDASVKKYKFNEFVSRLIPFYRELPDFRSDQCKVMVYSENLPKVSVVLSFYNEPFSMLMRTIYSVLKRSPKELIEEILLVDDASDDETVLKPLHEILSKIPKLRILRSPTRLGLMKARMLGAANAIGPVLVIMDSHVEVVAGWLPPLLQPIAEDPHTITLPGVEMYDRDTLEYVKAIVGNYDWVGGFTWELMYTWIRSKVPANDSVTPLPCPTMLGAAFVIRKDYFEYLGYYDTGFELWGGENLELSFKVWMCGGRMLQAFCSHIGHIFRDRPYWNDAADVSKLRNTDRLAEVWLDEYKIFYHRKTKFNSKTRTIGDISKELELKKKLKCKSFQWYLDNVYGKFEIPDYLKDANWIGRNPDGSQILS